jgi:hypothetical protein
MSLGDAAARGHARTTPEWARPFVLAGLGAYAVYSGLAFWLALGGFSGFESPAAVKALDPVLWVGRWRMFTDLRTTHTDLDLAVLGDDWQPVELAALAPLHWNEGPGYTRDAFLRDNGRLVQLAGELCTLTAGQAVRLTAVVFDKTPGNVEQPRVNPRSTRLLEHDCAR